MEKKPNHIWVCETYNVKVNESYMRANRLAAYFSTIEKVNLHVEWIDACAQSNGARLVDSDDRSRTYILSNKDEFHVNWFRSVIDADDLITGEA